MTYYQNLYRSIKGNLFGYFSLESFTYLLNSHLLEFSRPLINKPPKKETRRLLKRGQLLIEEITISRKEIEEIIQISDNKQLFEKDSALLFKLAKELHQEFEIELKTTIDVAYHCEREYFLLSFIKLLKSLKSNKVSSQIKGIISQFFSKLLEEFDLIQNLTKTIHQTFRNFQNAEGFIKKFYQNELKLLSKIMFLIFYLTNISLKDFKIVLILLEKSCSKIDNDNNNIHFLISKYYFFTIASKLIDNPNNLKNNSIIKKKKFLDTLKTFFSTKEWVNKKFQNGLLFLITLFFQSNQSNTINLEINPEDIFNKLIKDDVFIFFSKLIDHNSDKENKYFSFIFEKIIRNFLINNKQIIYGLKEEEIELSNNYELSGDDLLFTQSNNPSYLTNLFMFLKRLYENKPLLCQNYLKSKKNDLISILGEKIPLRLYLPFIKFIISLINDQKLANYIAKYLSTNKNPYFSWKYFSLILKKYCNLIENNNKIQKNYNREEFYDDYDDDKREEEPSVYEFNCLYGILRLISKILTYHESYSKYLLLQTNYSYLHLLFKIITYSFPNELKAEAFNLLSCFSKDEEIIEIIWKKLIVTKIFTKKGLLTDLERNEKPYSNYPELIAFLKFFYTLLSNSQEIPNLNLYLKKTNFNTKTDNKTNVETNIFWNYIKFCINNIFLKLESWNYQNIQQKYILVNYCLKIIYNILKKDEIEFDEQNNKYKHNIGLKLFLNIIQGNNIFLYLIKIILQKIPQSIDKNNNRIGIEKGILISLKIFNLILNNEKINNNNNNNDNNNNDNDNIKNNNNGFLKLILKQKDLISRIMTLIYYYKNQIIGHYSLNILYLLCTDNDSIQKITKIILESNEPRVIEGFMNIFLKDFQLFFNNNQFQKCLFANNSDDNDNDENDNDDNLNKLFIFQEFIKEFKLNQILLLPKNNIFKEDNELNENNKQINQNKKKKFFLINYENNENTSSLFFNNIENTKKKLKDKFSLTISEKLIKLFILIIDHQNSNEFKNNQINFLHYLIGFDFEKDFNKTNLQINYFACINPIFNILLNKKISETQPKFCSVCLEFIFKFFKNEMTKKAIFNYLNSYINNNNQNQNKDKMKNKILSHDDNINFGTKEEEEEEEKENVAIEKGYQEEEDEDDNVLEKLIKLNFFQNFDKEFYHKNKIYILNKQRWLLQIIIIFIEQHMNSKKKYHLNKIINLLFLLNNSNINIKTNTKLIINNNQDVDNLLKKLNLIKFCQFLNPLEITSNEVNDFQEINKKIEKINQNLFKINLNDYLILNQEYNLPKYNLSLLQNDLIKICEKLINNNENYEKHQMIEIILINFNDDDDDDYEYNNNNNNNKNKNKNKNKDYDDDNDYENKNNYNNKIKLNLDSDYLIISLINSIMKILNDNSDLIILNNRIVQVFILLLNELKNSFLKILKSNLIENKTELFSWFKINIFTLIFKKILETILFKNSNLIIRGHLYICLINFLEIFKIINEINNKNFDDYEINNKIKNKKLKNYNIEEFNKEILGIFLNHSSSLIKILMKDSINVNNKFSKISLLILEILFRKQYPLFSAEKHLNYWINMISKLGYLKKLFLPITENSKNEDLMIPPNLIPEFDFKIKFLTSIAYSPQRIKYLFENKIFYYISKISFELNPLYQIENRKGKKQNWNLINNFQSLKLETNLKLQNNNITSLLKFILTLCLSLPNNLPLFKKIKKFLNIHQNLILSIFDKLINDQNKDDDDDDDNDLDHSYTQLYCLTGIFQFLSKFPNSLNFQFFSQIFNLLVQNFKNIARIQFKQFENNVLNSHFSIINNILANIITIFHNVIIFSIQTNNPIFLFLPSNKINSNDRFINNLPEIQFLYRFIEKTIFIFTKTINYNKIIQEQNNFFKYESNKNENIELKLNLNNKMKNLSFNDSDEDDDYNYDYDDNDDDLESQSNFDSNFQTLLLITEKSLHLLYIHLKYFSKLKLINNLFLTKEKMKIENLLKKLSKFDKKLSFSQNYNSFIQLQIIQIKKFMNQKIKK
ncbi:finger protein [Anaeramoeba flamelloides]|uniref:Finger protein n=1 Tax=Anaeramoeba flamelloides TaxID=1746091 RepID=A0ABQ8XUF0_9EUKA|nr:finger protein [Anaeramoeba flamelloides]